MKKILGIVLALFIVCIIYNMVFDKNKKTENPKNPYSTGEIVVSNDEKMVNYFKQTEEDIDVSLQSSDNTLSESCKEKVVELVDFVFYDKEINGVKFKDLSDDTKEKLLGIVSSIDNKIESKVPNYKESIKTDTKDSVTTLMGYIKVGLSEVDKRLGATIGEDKYDNFKDNVSDAAETIIDKGKEIINSDTTSNIVDKGKEVIDNTKDKIKKWYEGWR